MSTKRKTKIIVTGGLGLLMLSFALLLMVVLPATKIGSVASEAQPTPPGMGGMPPQPGGMPMGGMGMGGMGMGGMGMGGALAAPGNIFEGDPFESSRPNPFSSVLGMAVGVGTKYGPNWDQMPLASRIEIGSVQRRPEAGWLAAPQEAFMHITGIMWAGDRPLAMYEMRNGDGGSVRVGDIVDDWLVEQIGQDYVNVRNVVTGEVRRLPFECKGSKANN